MNIARAIAATGALTGGYIAGKKMAVDQASEELKLRREQEAYAKNKALEDQLAASDGDFTPRQTEAASGEEAFAAVRRARDAELAAAQTDEQRAQVERNFAPTLQAAEADRGRAARVINSIGVGGAFRQQTAPFTSTDIQDAKAQERAGIYQSAGREEDASRVLLNAGRIQEITDKAELRAALAQGSNQAKQGVIDVIERGHDRNAADAYYQRKAPEVINTLIRQGKLEDAKRFRDFVDSEAGRGYAEQWSRGVRKLAIGDHRGALKDWQGLYNAQLYDDGKTVELTPVEDGKQVRADFFDQSGKQTHTSTHMMDAFAKQAGMALAPEKLVEFRAKQEEARQHEDAALVKAAELERLRQEGQDSRDDRRDERLARRLEDAANRRPGDLTPAQQRGNAEIDAARKAIAGLSPEAIRNRTQQYSATGRENKDHDPNLAHQVALANRRKIGADDEFDQRQPAAPAFDRADIAKRFRADKDMLNRTLGNDTSHGIEVLEKGKVIGYYR